MSEITLAEVVALANAAQRALLPPAEGAHIMTIVHKVQALTEEPVADAAVPNPQVR